MLLETCNVESLNTKRACDKSIVSETHMSMYKFSVQSVNCIQYLAIPTIEIFGLIVSTCPGPCMSGVYYFDVISAHTCKVASIRRGCILPWALFC